MKFFKKESSSIISQVVILSIIFGFGAGVVGQIVSDVYIDPYGQDFLLENSSPGTDVILELRPVKRFLGIEQDFEVNESIQKVSTAIAGLYREKTATSNILNQIYLPSDLVASSFILTTDGWLVTYLDGLDSSDLVVIHNGQVFNIIEEIKDSTTGVSFLKISASNLPVAVLGDSEEAVLGQLEVVINDVDQAVVTNIKSLDYSENISAGSFVLVSEEYNKSISLTDSLGDSHIGSPLINLAGEVVGIISGSDTAVPINQFRSVIVDVLRNGLIKRAYLGISYIDLAKTVGLDSELTQGLNRGALVYQDPVRDTPAFNAGLEEDDIILSVDGQLVNNENSLTELIQQYQPGDEVTLEILRDEETSAVSIVLSILE